MSITILQLQKRASYKFKNIQDKFASNEANKCFALADGTTQSFNSETWAEIITKHFVDAPTFENQKLISNFTSCVQEFKNTKFEYSTAPAIASLEKEKQNKGGTATFIGLQFVENNQLNVINSGDTNLFIVRNDEVDSFPYKEIETLDANNFFINTEQLLQNKIDETYFQTKTFFFNSGDIFILATDALSRLFLKQPKTISEFIDLDDFERLHNFCLTYWENKQMEEDDISAIIIKVESKNQIRIIQPPKDFSFPKEEEKPFVPEPPIIINNPFNDMNIQEIKNNFNGIANDFQQVKKKLKFHEMLLMIAISIGFLNLLCFFYFKPDTDKTEKEIPKQKSEIIESINQAIQPLKSIVESLEKKVMELSTPKKEIESNPVDSKPKTQISGEEENKKKQEELKKAGYDVTADGKWGDKSEKAWKDYLSKKELKKTK